MTKEQILSGDIAEFMMRKYPKVIYRFDAVADMKITIGQASRVKRLHGEKNRGYPDLFIAKPNKYYHGLYLELKATGSSPFKLNGELKKSEHLKTQQRVHDKLRDEGYEAKFVTGLKEAIEVIEDYMDEAK